MAILRNACWTISLRGKENQYELDGGQTKRIEKNGTIKVFKLGKHSIIQCKNLNVKLQYIVIIIIFDIYYYVVTSTKI